MLLNPGKRVPSRETPAGDHFAIVEKWRCRQHRHRFAFVKRKKRLDAGHKQGPLGGSSVIFLVLMIWACIHKALRPEHARMPIFLPQHRIPASRWAPISERDCEMGHS